MIYQGVEKQLEQNETELMKAREAAGEQFKKFETGVQMRQATKFIDKTNKVQERRTKAQET